MPDYSGAPAPFSCPGNSSCPSGYYCSSEVCIQNGAPALPTLLAHSADAIQPRIVADPDRSGELLYWTRTEETENAQGHIYGAFVRADGSTSGVVVLGTFDSRGRSVLVSAAALPQSRGQLVVGLWIGDGAQSQVRLTLWTPDQPNGESSTSNPVVLGTDTNAGGYQPDRFEIATVGTEVWALVETPIQVPGFPTVSTNVSRYRLSAATLDAGLPAAELLTSNPLVQITTESVDLLPSDSGAWAAVNSAFGQRWSYVTHDVSPTTGVPWLPAVPSAAPGFGIPLATNGEQLAVLWNLPVTNPRTDLRYRLAWLQRSVIAIMAGPELPFSRLETRYPGAFRVDNVLYVIGAPGTGAGVSDAGGVGLDDAGTSLLATYPTNAHLNVYRIPWAAGSSMIPDPVMEIPRARLGDRPVVAAAAALLPGSSTSFVAAWVDFSAANALRGAEYILYTSVNVLPN